MRAHHGGRRREPGGWGSPTGGGGQATHPTATGPYGEGADGARQGLGASTGRRRSSVEPPVILQVAGTEGELFRDTMGETFGTLTPAERGNAGGGKWCGIPKSPADTGRSQAIVFLEGREEAENACHSSSNGTSKAASSPVTTSSGISGRIVLLKSDKKEPGR